MAITTGDKLPNATLLRMGEEGPETVDLHSLIGEGPAVIFGLPGAYTGVCSTAHVPSFIRTKDQFAEEGIDTIICVSVNDPFVMEAWGKDTGASEAGIHMLADPESDFIRTLGLQFSAPPAGLIDRAKRFAMVIEDGAVAVIEIEDNPGLCERSAGEGLLRRYSEV
ncbi:MAG: peroxiredoxin [Rhodobacterales bacterium]|nr:MAG: peroxiredoxin [Rhodobacterales bacterium]